MPAGRRARVRAVWGVVVIGLGAASVARAESPRAAPAPVGSAPAARSPAPAGSGAPAAGAAPGASGQPATPKPPGVTGGYAWTDKPRARRGRRRIRRAFDPTAPVATFPGFRMLPGGGSQVFVSLSKPVDVQVRRSPGRVVYVLGGAVVAIRNNTNALVTTYFDTPLSRARLVPAKGGAQLLLELREAVEPTFTVQKLPGGWVTLQVTLPPAADAASAPAPAPATSAPAPATSAPAPATSAPAPATSATSK